jgi:senataxin
MPFYNPSLDEMNKEVLAWDLYHMLEGRAMYSLRDVPVRFSSVDEYLDVFEPLLLEECRAQTLRSLHENDGRESHVQLRSVEPHEPFRIIHFDAPTESSTKPTYFDTDLVFVSHEPLDLHTRAEANGSSKVPPKLKGQQFHALALVNKSSPGTLALKLYLPEEPTSRLPPSQHKRLHMLRKVMVPASGKWYIRKLGNMVTINREFQALYSVRELVLASKLLTPGGMDGSAPPPSLQPPPTLLKAIEATHNPSQLLAIRTCLCGRGVTLIQGPPGTGKTKTILGILSVLLASEASKGGSSGGQSAIDARPAWPFKRALAAGNVSQMLAAASPWLHPSGAKAEEGEEAPGALVRQWTAVEADGPSPAAAANAPAANAASAAAGAQSAEATDPNASLPPYPYPTAAVSDLHLQLGKANAEAPPKHVLVCAPSNAAIDEIVSRLLQHTGPGMLNERGESYVPLVVRVGPNIKESLMDVALDTLAKKRQAEHGDALTYDAAKMQVLNEAAIVCTTLSCAGYSMFSQLKQGFDTVLIDEAAQAVEMSTLIPLKYACRRLILVGDPNQLPATVFSDHSMRHNYEQSLFQRLQIGGQRVAMLTTQYRMHPHISRFPGRRFYNGALKDAPSMAQLRAAPWHERRCLGPYVFYDVNDGIASEVASSWSNELEAQLAMQLVKHLLSHYPERITPPAIGIISPYNAQVRRLRKLFAEGLGADVASLIEVNSVDGFQGREKDVVVLSVVRSDRGRTTDGHSRKSGIGFLRDARRMNVSITRARTSVFVLGHAETLREDTLWDATLHDASERRCLVRAHSPIGIWFESAVKELALLEPPPANGEGEGEPASKAAVSASPVAQRGVDSPIAGRKRPARGAPRPAGVAEAKR